MSRQTVAIQVTPQTAAILQEKAAAQGKSLDDFLRAAFEEPSGAQAERPFYETASTEEWLKAFNEWVSSHPKNTPGLTLEDVSRESIYGDR